MWADEDVTWGGSGCDAWENGVRLASHELGSRFLHEWRMEASSGADPWRWALLSSTSIDADSCSSWNCWNIWSSGVCDCTSIDGREHQWASACWMPSLQRCSASCSLPSWMAAYVFSSFECG